MSSPQINYNFDPVARTALAKNRVTLDNFATYTPSGASFESIPHPDLHFCKAIPIINGIAWADQARDWFECAGVTEPRIALDRDAHALMVANSIRMHRAPVAGSLTDVANKMGASIHLSEHDSVLLAPAHITRSSNMYRESIPRPFDAKAEAEHQDELAIRAKYRNINDKFMRGQSIDVTQLDALMGLGLADALAVMPTALATPKHCLSRHDRATGYYAGQGILMLCGRPIMPLESDPVVLGFFYNFTTNTVTTLDPHGPPQTGMLFGIPRAMLSTTVAADALAKSFGRAALWLLQTDATVRMLFEAGLDAAPTATYDSIMGINPIDLFAIPAGNPTPAARAAIDARQSARAMMGKAPFGRPAAPKPAHAQAMTALDTVALPALERVVAQCIGEGRAVNADIEDAVYEAVGLALAQWQRETGNTIHTLAKQLPTCIAMARHHRFNLNMRRLWNFLVDAEQEGAATAAATPLPSHVTSSEARASAMQLAYEVREAALGDNGMIPV
jgi:hypothetical protein